MRPLIALLATTTVVLSIMTTSRADLSWGFSSDLSAWDSSIVANWFVQMYHDVDDDTTVGSVTHFDLAGGVFGGNSTDDVLLGSFTALTLDAKGEIVWGENFAPGEWSSLFNQTVYSVLYNASSIALATEAVIIDATPHTLGGSDPYEYSIASVGNDWVSVIPEPSTMALLGMGVIGLFGLRRRMVK